MHYGITQAGSTDKLEERRNSLLEKIEKWRKARPSLKVDDQSVEVDPSHTQLDDAEVRQEVLVATQSYLEEKHKFNNRVKVKDTPTGKCLKDCVGILHASSEYYDLHEINDLESFKTNVVAFARKIKSRGRCDDMTNRLGGDFGKFGCKPAYLHSYAFDEHIKLCKTISVLETQKNIIDYFASDHSDGEFDLKGNIDTIHLMLLLVKNRH